MFVWPYMARDEYKGAGEKGYEDGHSLSGNLRNGLSSPDLLESSDVEWSAMPNLDLFFTRVYRCSTLQGGPEKAVWLLVPPVIMLLSVRCAMLFLVTQPQPSCNEFISV